MYRNIYILLSAFLFIMLGANFVFWSYFVNIGPEFFYNNGWDNLAGAGGKMYLHIPSFVMFCVTEIPIFVLIPYCVELAKQAESRVE